MQAQQNKPQDISSKATGPSQKQSKNMISVVNGKTIVSAVKADEDTHSKQRYKTVDQPQAFDFVGIAG